MNSPILPTPRQQPPDPADPPDPAALSHPASGRATAAGAAGTRIPHLLAGRMLLQVGTSRVGWIRDQVDSSRSGLVISGTGAASSLAGQREKGFTGPALLDLAVYTQFAASEDEPFPSLTSGQLCLTDPLEHLVEEQLAHGAAAAMAPTGYIHAEDSDALLAAAARVRDLGDPRLIFTLPVDVAWLRDEPVRQLIAVMQSVPGVKALMLGGQMDPLAGFPTAVGNLQRILAEVPGTALLRADLAAFGALAHGAAFTAYGATSSVRHIVPPEQPAASSGKNGGPACPHVLLPELMDFFLGQTLAKRFAGSPPPLCHCQACTERDLTTFTSNSEQVPAAAHNAAVLTQWLGTMDAVEAGAARQRWWQYRCAQAVDRYPLLNAELRLISGFKVPAQLRRWAQVSANRTTAVPEPTGQPTTGTPHPGAS